jgi:hypothetical protein
MFVWMAKREEIPTQRVRDPEGSREDRHLEQLPNELSLREDSPLPPDSLTQPDHCGAQTTQNLRLRNLLDTCQPDIREVFPERLRHSMTPNAIMPSTPTAAAA